MYFIHAALILASMISPIYAAEGPVTQTGSCATEFAPAATTEPAPAPRGLAVRTIRSFDVGGDAWMAAHLTRSGRTLLGTVDQRGVLRTFDVDRDLELAVAASPESPDVTYTRGEWVESAEGELAIALGDYHGYMQWFGVEPSTLSDQFSSGIARALVPLATISEGNESYVLVSSGERLFRIRVMPAPAGAVHEYQPISTDSRVLRAAHFLATDGRNVIAALSRHAIEVFELTNAHARYGDNLSNGERAWTTWFENGDVGLVVADERQLHLHFPLAQRPPIKTALDARVAGRVHALTTSTGSTFVLVPTDAGAEIFRYADGSVRNWAKLPTAIADHQKGVFRGPNDRIYVVWTDEPTNHEPRLNISEFAQEMNEPVDSMHLMRGERVTHVQALHVPHGLMYLFIKTTQRTLLRRVQQAVR